MRCGIAFLQPAPNYWPETAASAVRETLSARLADRAFSAVRVAHTQFRFRASANRQQWQKRWQLGNYRRKVGISPMSWQLEMGSVEHTELVCGYPLRAQLCHHDCFPLETSNAAILRSKKGFHKSSGDPHSGRLRQIETPTSERVRQSKARQRSLSPAGRRVQAN